MAASSTNVLADTFLPLASSSLLSELSACAHDAQRLVRALVLAELQELRGEATGQAGGGRRRGLAHWRIDRDGLLVTQLEPSSGAPKWLCMRSIR